MGFGILISTLQVMRTLPSVSSGMYSCNAYNGLIGRESITRSHASLLVYGKLFSANEVQIIGDIINILCCFFSSCPNNYIISPVWIFSLFC